MWRNTCCFTKILAVLALAFSTISLTTANRKSVQEALTADSSPGTPNQPELVAVRALQAELTARRLEKNAESMRQRFQQSNSSLSQKLLALNEEKAKQEGVISSVVNSAADAKLRASNLMSKAKESINFAIVAVDEDAKKQVEQIAAAMAEKNSGEEELIEAKNLLNKAGELTKQAQEKKAEGDKKIAEATQKKNIADKQKMLDTTKKSLLLAEVAGEMNPAQAAAAEIASNMPDKDILAQIAAVKAEQDEARALLEQADAADISQASVEDLVDHASKVADLRRQAELKAQSAAVKMANLNEASSKSKHAVEALIAAELMKQEQQSVSS